MRALLDTDVLNPSDFARYPEITCLVPPNV
jgi:hypothetical protein